MLGCWSPLSISASSRNRCLSLLFSFFSCVNKKIVRLFMEAERELIGCQSRTDVIIRSSRHGATGAFTLHVFQSIISGRENSIGAIHGAKTKSPPHGDLRKRKSPYLIENCSGMPLSKKESFNVVQLLFCKNPSIDQSNCAVVKRQGRHFPQCPSRKSRKEGRTRPCTRQEMGHWATGKNET